MKIVNGVNFLIFVVVVVVVELRTLVKQLE